MLANVPRLEASAPNTEVAELLREHGAVIVEGVLDAGLLERFNRELLEPMAWRNIGPTNMGGRITDLAVYEAKPVEAFVVRAQSPSADQASGSLESLSSAFFVLNSLRSRPLSCLSSVALAEEEAAKDRRKA